MKDLETMQTSSPQQGHGEVAPSKFTPGPWRIDQHSTRPDYAMVSGGNWSWLAEVAVRINGEDEPEGHANARMIVAAPTMLEAHQENARILGFLVNELLGRIDAGKLAALATCSMRSQAAIRKATGEP